MDAVTKRLPELLAPAGNKEALIAAIHAGADAVYLAGPRFGARAYAENFTEEELVRSIWEAHVFGVRIFLTVNILTRDSELADTVAFVKRLEEAGLDGVIVQDLGVVEELHRVCPRLKIHASTQMSVTTAEGVRFLKRRGVRRIVPARELSPRELRLLKDEGIEIEAFIHGAMCYAYSGRCLFSSFLGGRSGNRGRCAGTCRLPFDILDESGKRQLAKEYDKGECYPLSMKDMTVLSILPDVLDCGVDSLKIEGRMKRPEYVAGVTAMYRKYLDRFAKWDADGRGTPWRVEPEDEALLSRLYIRSDTNTGYYRQENGRELVTMGRGGYAGTPEDILERLEKEYCGKLRPRSIRASLALLPGEPARLAVALDEGKEKTSSEERAQDKAGTAKKESAQSVTVEGAVAEPASKRPLEEETILRQLTKTGETPFALAKEAVSIHMPDAVFLPVSALNALRRDALEALLRKVGGRALPEEAEEIDTDPQQGGSVPFASETAKKTLRGLVAQVQDPGQYQAALEAGVSTIILDFCGDAALWKGLAEQTTPFLSPQVHHWIALPPVFRERSREALCEAIRRARPDGFVARTVEEVLLLREEGVDGPILADASLYTWNRAARESLAGLCDAFVLPYELQEAQIKNMEAGQSVLSLYGRAELMVSAGCVRKTAAGCRPEGGYWSLEDRKGARFPVRLLCGEDRAFCQNVIYNAVPTSLHRHMGGSWLQGLLAGRLSFTTERPKEVEELCRFYLALWDARGTETARSIPVPHTLLEEGSYTTGHFRKGAL